MEDDSYRFADDTARKLHKEKGVYGGDVVPGTSVKTITGVARGEELFHRPEMYRPWRSSSAQKHASVVVSKEQEIEVLTRRSTDLRSQLATANRELQRLQLEVKTAVDRVSCEKTKEIDAVRKELAETKTALEETKSTHEHQTRLLRSEHETEMAKLQTKMKSVQAATNEMGNTYFKQMQEVKSAAAREVELIQQLCHARTGELSNELQAATDSVRRLQDRNTGSLGEMQTEMKRSEERCLEQLRNQEKRFESMRETLQAERQQVEQQRDVALTDLSLANERIKTLAYDLNETESRFKDWNVRLLSDLDQIFEYYASIIDTNEFAAEETAPSSFADVFIPPRNEGDHASKNVMDRITHRLKQLTMMKQQQSSSTQNMVRKIKTLEGTVATSQEAFQRHANEKDSQLTRLHTEAGDIKARQERLDRAFAEVQSKVEQAEVNLTNASSRLQFFSDDLENSLNGLGTRVLPPKKDVVLVVTTVEGAIIQWEKNPGLMQSAMTLLNDALRFKMKEYGGYESCSDADSIIFAFTNPVNACRFSLECQKWLLQLNWPKELLNCNSSKEEMVTTAEGHKIVFRGLRVGMSIHTGDVNVNVTNLPTGMGETQVRYYGRAFMQLLHMASFASGGQVIVSSSVWQMIRDKLAEIGSPSVTDLGEHRLAIGHREGGEDNFASSEVMGLVQILPQDLAARHFSRVSSMTANNAAGAIGIAQHLSPFRRLAVQAEITALREQHVQLSRAMETLTNESQVIGTSVNAIACKLRDSQIHGRIYSQADIVTHLAAVDRVVGRTEVVKADIQRSQSCMKDVGSQMKNLEDVLMVHTKMSMSEDEFKKRIEITHERCNEKIYEAALQSEHKVQQFKNAVTKLDTQNHDLKQQLLAGQSASIDEALRKERKLHQEEMERAQRKITALAQSVDKSKSSTRFDNIPRVARSADGRPSSASRKPVVAKNSSVRSKLDQDLAAATQF